MRLTANHICCLLGAVLMIALECHAQSIPGKFPIKNFTPSDYKAGIQNIDIAQNRDMMLYVANNLGVLSFNGREWEVHPSNKGKKVRSLAFDPKTDRLYAGLQGDIGYFEDDWNYVSLLDKVPTPHQDFDEVWDVFIMDTIVYFCTFQNIYIYDHHSIYAVGYQKGLDRSFLKNRKLYTQSEHGVLLELVDRNLVAALPQSEQNSIISGIIPWENGYLLFYRSGSIEYSTSFGVERRHAALSAALAGTFVNHVLQLSRTRLAISTQTSGVFLYDLLKQNITRITAEDGLLTNVCLRAFEDYSGNLWVGMQNGVAMIDISSPMRLSNQEIGLFGSGYDAYENDEGRYYTTSNGIYYMARNASRCTFISGTEGPAYAIQKIAGKLYAGHHSGLFLLDQGEARRVAKTNGLWCVKQLRSNPEYAIAGTYSGLYLFMVDKNKELEAVDVIEGFEESSRFVEEDEYGKIWVSQYYKGLYKLSLSEDLTKATVSKMDTQADIPIEEQIILKRIDDLLYLATDKGLYKLDHINDAVSEENLFSQVIGRRPIYLIQQDANKNVHIVAENLVGFFEQVSTNNYTFVPSSLFQLRYYFNNDLLNIAINTNETVLYSANEGFIHYYPELESHTTAKNPVVVKRVISPAQNKVLFAHSPFEVRSEHTEEVILDPIDKLLRIEVESFQFNDADNLRFRYRLEGFDEDYEEWTNTTIKEYTNLAHGTYKFTAQIQNHLSEISTSRPLIVHVRPTFFESTFGNMLLLLLGLGIIFAAYTMLARIHKRNTMKIQEAKQRELEETQLQLDGIKREKERELQQMKEDKLESELRHTNKLLAASMMNLVVKNEFMESVKVELDTVSRRGKNVETRQALEKIVRGIDSTLRVHEDWEQFEYHFDQVHGDFLTRLRNRYIELSPNDQKLCAFLRLNLNTKDIANLMGISLRGVEVARYRLRKKLNLPKGQNLSKFILEF